ncbi:hypothetical protein [Niveispirillum sp. KHB5.9]|uniref:hypothetical protein n=1 Tax=Niveispirillum sp. KHB5.9 TaxID=3400269 RepID=UPI003A8B6C6D
MAFRLLLVLLSLLSLCVPAGALSIPPPEPWGCDGESDQVRPSSFDLAARADVILVAEAGADITVPYDRMEDYHPPSVAMRTRTVLKGWAPAAFDLPLGFYTMSMGQMPDGCVPFSPRKGQSYLLYLRQEGDRLVILPVVGSATATPYQGPGDFAATLARLYLDMQRDLAPDAQLQRLDAMLRDRLRPDADPEEQWQARQIMDHLRSISPLMPTGHLLELHKLFSAGGMPEWGMRRGWYASRFDDQPWDAFRREAMEKPQLTPLDGRDQVMVALSTGRHPAAAPLFDAGVKAQWWSYDILMQAVGNAVHAGQGQRAMDLVAAHYLKLTAYAASDFPQIIFTLGKVMTGQAGMDRTSALWRSDPVLVAQWPTMATRLALQARLRPWDLTDTALGTAIAAAPLTRTSENDFREMRKMQAAAGGKPALDWAMAELQVFQLMRDKRKPVPPISDPDRALAFGMLLHQEGRAAVTRAVASDLYCAGGYEFGRMLDLLVENAQDFDIAASLLASDRLDARERLRLIEAMLSIHGRGPRPTPQTVASPYDDPPPRSTRPLLAAAFRGERGTGRPFTCPAGSARMAMPVTAPGGGK